MASLIHRTKVCSMLAMGGILSLFVLSTLLLSCTNANDTLEIITSGTSPFDKYPIIDELHPHIAMSYKKSIAQNEIKTVAAKLLSLHLILDGEIAEQAVAVDYVQHNNKLYLIPPNGLGNGLRFAIKRKLGFGTSTTIFHTPQFLPTEQPLPKVVQWYPSGNTAPANTLVYYAILDAPVGVNVNTVQAFDIRDPSGNSVVQNEHRTITFNPTHFRRNITYTQLIPIMIHPGRIKRGVHPREQLGLPVLPGNTYTFVIDASQLKDKYLRALQDIPSKTYTILDEDRTLPKFYPQHSRAPSAGTKDPVLLVFSEPMDYDSIQQGVFVLQGRTSDDEESQQISLVDMLTITHDKVDSRWLFYPKEEWKSTEYTVEITENTKDLAHNSLHIPFETETVEEKANVYSEYWYFTPRE